MIVDSFAELGIQVNAKGAIEQRAACPQCSIGGRDDALGVNITTGIFHCFRCGYKGRVTGQSGASGLARIGYFDDPATADRRRERLQETWRRSVLLSDCRARAVITYLGTRGLGEILREPPKALRAHPGLKYWDGTRLLGTFPAMLGLFAGSAGQPVTLHVTYLRSDGCAKASVPNPRKILGVTRRGATRGGAIRLYDPIGGVLGVAEGIESALSLRILQGFPVWASFCADNLERVRLPSDLCELHIAVDLDHSGKGEQVATALGQRVLRWRPRMKVTLWRPEIDGPGDLNDELMHKRAR